MMPRQVLTAALRWAQHGGERKENAMKPNGARYEIVDHRTGRVVAHAKTLRGACRACDRRDAEYGAVRYSHRRIDWPAPDAKPAN
jgi:hypothetical protein